MPTTPVRTKIQVVRTAKVESTQLTLGELRDLVEATEGFPAHARVDLNVVPGRQPDPAYNSITVRDPS